MKKISEVPNQIVFGDNLEVIKQLPDNCFKIIYIDPPFLMRCCSKKTSIKTFLSEKGDRVGYKGKTYTTIKGNEYSYSDILKNTGIFRTKNSSSKTFINRGRNFLSTFRL